MTEHNECSSPPADVLQAKIALETAQIKWRELQRFFAAGKAVAVRPDLDLVEVAAALASDSKAQLEVWLAQESVAPVSDEQAEHWYASNTSVWAVVVAPWVLVQAKPLGEID